MNKLISYGKLFNKIIKQESSLFNQKRFKSKEQSKLVPVDMAFDAYVPAQGSNLESILIMHGLLGSKSNWKSISKEIVRKSHRMVLAVDARNHGESPHTDEFSYPLLAEDINHFSYNGTLPKIYIGHSMGGRAMMCFALNYPDKVHKIIIVDISPVDRQIESMQQMASYFEAVKSIKLDNYHSMSEGRKLADNSLKATIKDPLVRQFILTNLKKQQDGTFSWRVNIASLAKHFDDNISRFPEIIENKICKKPALFIGGLKSNFLMPDHHNEILKLFPRAEFTYMDTGHWVHAEKPHEFIQTVLDFINSPHTI